MSHIMGRVRIEGEFLDSYVYSGILYLASSDGDFHAFRWDALVRSVLDVQGECAFRDALLDSRELINSHVDVGGSCCELYLDREALAAAHISSASFAELPADWSIFSNRLYCATDQGVCLADIKWEMGFQQTTRWQRLFDGRALKVSPNSFDRCAVAAGTDGLIALVSRRSAQKVLTDEYCWDCDWQDNVLVASSEGGAFRAQYVSLPQVARHNADWSTINALKAKPPLKSGRVQAGVRSLCFVWLGGGRLFAVDEQLQLYSSIDSEPGGQQLETLASLARSDTEAAGELCGIRSAPYGTVAEFGDRLFLFSESGMMELACSVGRWRVFPRAKSYANHLHIVKEDHLEIVCVSIPRTADLRDRLGYSWHSIPERD